MGAQEIRQVTIEEFVAGLEALENLPSDQVWEYLGSHAVRPETLEPYSFFSPARYSRNLIFKNDVFELLALGWEIGQVSTVHDHRNQRCWVVVSTGKLMALNYRVVERNPQALTCRLEATRSCLLPPGTLTKVEKEEPVHQMLNLKEWNQRAVSLHLYSKPFRTCEVYQPDRGTYSEMELYYTSLYGKPCQEKTPAVRH